MSLKYGKRELTAMIDAIDSDHETVEDAARAALEAAEEIFERRAKFVVVGQLKASSERLAIPPDDPEAIKISLGWYSTEGEARNAAESLWFSTASGDEFRTWVLPVFHGTPAEFHKTRKRHYMDLQAKAKEEQIERLKAQIRQREEEDQRRADEMRRVNAA